MRNTVLALLLAIWLPFASSANAALMSIEALYNAPGINGTTASITGIFDDAGLTGSGFEDFFFIGDVQLNFAPNVGGAVSGGSFLAEGDYTVQDMFGIQFFNGVPFDVINNNNLDPDGSSKLIFQSVLPLVLGYGIWMPDNSTAMHVEHWSVVNHQGGQAHGLVDFRGPVPVDPPNPMPVPGVLSLMLLSLLLLRRRVETLYAMA